MASSNISRERADEHIREIRARKGADRLDGDGLDNACDLDRALKILSSQLYEKDTHFILELIQNADDNTYDQVVPTLIFTCHLNNTGWSLQMNCNEVGFKRENVEALCRIGDSTKRARDRTRGFIGEKGIGFKSVFKVADVVRIHSRAYSFAFDQSKTLGMITPFVDNSSWQVSQRDNLKTSMLLELKDSSEYRLIIDEFDTLEPQILLFLRKISKLQIDTFDRTVLFEITRTIEDHTLDRKETATLTRRILTTGARASGRYIIVRHQELLEQGLDDRRSSIRESEVVLAFQIGSDCRPVIKSQRTYAFLPINDYGFSYLIQGDFLLVANRESVISSRWNDKILLAVCRAFVHKAVPRFNEICNVGTASLRYTWPLYLKDRRDTNEFWSKLKRSILRELATSEILESRHNHHLCRPPRLRYIGADFRLGSLPLVEDTTSARRHLSFSYDSDDSSFLSILCQLGVEKMDIDDFVQELREHIARIGSSYFEDQSSQWHSKLADVLRRRIINKSSLFDIPLIPLRDGTWVTCSHRHLFLEEDNSDATIPRGLDIHLVQAEASRDPLRKAFFRWLGIKGCDRAEVCKMIVERYSRRCFPTLATAVDDAIYLFKTPQSSQISGMKRVLLFGAPPLFHLMNGVELYVEEATQVSIISRYAENPRSAMPLLHPDYLNNARRLGQESDFIRWICSDLDVSTKPRLVDIHGRLTPTFTFLKDVASKDLLVLLRDSWHFYASSLDRRGSALKTALKEMNVVCTDGQLRPIAQTMLPRRRLKDAAPNLPCVDLPDPENILWNKLDLFGVLTKESSTLYLLELKALAQLPVNNTATKLAVEAVYAGLQSFISTSDGQIRTDFHSLSLIFINNSWVHWSECVWSGERLRTFYNLRTEYSRYKRLFQSYLRLGNVKGSHIVTELRYMSNNPSTDRLKELLILLNKYFRVEVPNDLMTNLRGKRIFPVTNLGGNIDYRSYDEDDWYLADRQSLRDSFDGKLPLLDLDVKIVRQLQPLIEALQIRSRQLSVADDSRLENVGTPIYDNDRTQDLKQRAIHLLQLTPDRSFGDRLQLDSRLTSLKVWGVSEIKLLHKVGSILGIEERGSVIFDEGVGDTLDIYISFNGLVQAVLDNELSKQFMRCFSIPESKLKLVGPILNYPLENLRHFLDEHGLDESLDQRQSPTSESEPDTEINEDMDRSLIIDGIRDIASTPTRPNAGRRSAIFSSATENHTRSYPLHDRIPTLDESISIVRRAAALSSTAPALIITTSQVQMEPSNQGIPYHNNASDTIFPGAADAQAPSQPRSGIARPSLMLSAGEGSEMVDSALDLTNFQATFAEVFSPETPFRTSLRTSTQGFSSSNLRRGQRTSRSNPLPDSRSTMQGLHHQYIGLLGEVFVNEWLSRELNNDWNPVLYWTSRNRNSVYPDLPFRGNEGDYADFTYTDTRGDLSRLLARHGFIQNVLPWLAALPTFHLEVKSTTESCHEPFYMSNNQVEKARGWSFLFDGNTVPEHVYVVIRVYNLERDIPPGFTALVDPWSMYLRRELGFSADGGYVITLSGR